MFMYDRRCRISGGARAKRTCGTKTHDSSSRRTYVGDHRECILILFATVGNAAHEVVFRTLDRHTDVRVFQKLSLHSVQ